MDQVAGPAIASLDQPVGPIIEEPDGPSVDAALISDDGLFGSAAAVISAPEPAAVFSRAAESGAFSLSLPGAPPPPAWLTRRPDFGASRRASRIKALLALLGMALAATVLAYTAVSLALKGLAARPAGDQATAAKPLIWPAPDTAGGLPLHSPVVGNPGTRRVIAQFRRRFTALLNGSSAVYPAALYNEPGRVDLTTGSPAWVMYVGYNERPHLTDPAATVSRLMASLAGPAGNVRPWLVTAGPAGGTARCVVARVGITEVAVCGWATDVTIGAVLSPTRDTSVSELAVLMSQMRPDLQPG
jgi:hypothetical protein